MGLHNSIAAISYHDVGEAVFEKLNDRARKWYVSISPISPQCKKIHFCLIEKHISSNTALHAGPAINITPAMSDTICFYRSRDGPSVSKA